MWTPAGWGLPCAVCCCPAPPDLLAAEAGRPRSALGLLLLCQLQIHLHLLSAIEWALPLAAGLLHVPSLAQLAPCARWEGRTPCERALELATSVLSWVLPGRCEAWGQGWQRCSAYWAQLV